MSNLDVIFPDNIRNSLEASMVAVVETAMEYGTGDPVYVRGVLAMAHSIALAYGLKWRLMLLRTANEAALGGWYDILLDAGGSRMAELMEGEQ